MRINKNTLESKMNRRKALAKLGLAAVTAYATPILLKLNPAAASSGGGSGAGGASGGANLLSKEPLTDISQMASNS